MTQAWSLAMALGIEQKTEPLLFELMMASRTLKNKKDIREIFVKAGISGNEYDRVSASNTVTEMTKQQKRLLAEYKVEGTPSVFVNGKYRVDNRAFRADSVEVFRDKYVSVVKQLLNLAE